MSFYVKRKALPYDFHRKVRRGSKEWYRIQWRRTGLFSEDEIEEVLKEFQEEEF